MSRPLELALCTNVGGAALILLVGYRRDGRACGLRLLEPHPPLAAEVTAAVRALDSRLARGMRAAGLARATGAADVTACLAAAVARQERGCSAAVREAFRAAAVAGDAA